VAFVEFAVVEFLAVEDKFLLHESFIFKDGHYYLTIRRAESASLAGAVFGFVQCSDVGSEALEGSFDGD